MIPSPYLLILLNLIHLQAAALGIARPIVFLRRGAYWRPQLLDWAREQERQMRVLLVLSKQVAPQKIPRAGQFFMIKLAEGMGWVFGCVLACLPFAFIKSIFQQTDSMMTFGLERAGHQIAQADLVGWEIKASVNPPRALLELAEFRRGWPSLWEHSERMF